MTLFIIRPLDAGRAIATFRVGNQGLFTFKVAEREKLL